MKTKSNKHNLFIRIVKDEKNFLKYKAVITEWQGALIIELLNKTK